MSTTKKKTAKKKVTKKKAAKKKGRSRVREPEPRVETPDAGSPVDVIAQAGDPESPHTVARYDDPLMVHPPDSPFVKYELARRVASRLAQSNLVPEAYQGRPNDCFVALNMGAELGMEPFQAIQSIAVIDGKPCLYGDGLIGVVRASPLCEWIKEDKPTDDNMSATCTTKRKGDPHEITATYTMADAERAGISTRFNWQKHPKRMLQMRARAYCLRDAYPDILKGLGVVEEMQDHEDTPPEITSFDLPKVQPEPPYQPQGTVIDGTGSPELDEARKVFGEGTHIVTFESVERAMHQSDTMEQLLAAAKDAKFLDQEDQTKLRRTYKKMRDVLNEPQS